MSSIVSHYLIIPKVFDNFVWNSHLFYVIQILLFYGKCILLLLSSLFATAKKYCSFQKLFSMPCFKVFSLVVKLRRRLSHSLLLMKYSRGDLNLKLSCLLWGWVIVAHLELSFSWLIDTNKCSCLINANQHNRRVSLMNDCRCFESHSRQNHDLQKTLLESKLT